MCPHGRGFNQCQGQGQGHFSLFLSNEVIDVILSGRNVCRFQTIKSNRYVSVRSTQVTMHGRSDINLYSHS